MLDQDINDLYAYLRNWLPAAAQPISRTNWVFRNIRHRVWAWRTLCFRARAHDRSELRNQPYTNRGRYLVEAL